ncbi:hypothetical protein AYL99_01695 [Fonsecaea erecta]|uniref:Uncharacterized protein n=1 Tax=Fonsecaea erecta TaxID=1367422 RepID=A0A179A2U5_9EURO|nr:hypothetical protein AYL99_01695 [Fonsecaea erecta]OAP65723.1 hypothetical protein AYL99_01695 [Fonsecaea erecta]
MDVISTAAAMQDVMENERHLLTAANTEDTTALVRWITHDLYLPSASPPVSPAPKQPSSLLDPSEECDMSRPRMNPKVEPKLDHPQIDPGIHRPGLTVQGLLC